jgi:glycosyltransferase involved in cell wall biosynthesis
MRIGIDARFYGTIGKGLGRYTSELIAQLEQLDNDDEYVIFLRRENFDDYVPGNPRFTKVLAEFPWYGWREQVLFPMFLRKHRIDLVHFCHFNVPLLYRGPFVVTIHDLILLRHPTTRATTLGPLRYAIKYALYRTVIGSAVRRAKAVITVSECTKREIVAEFPAASRKPVVVTYEACGTRFTAPHADSVPPFAQPYALYVGNAYPHKNLERLLEAFTTFRKDGHQDWTLALVGAEDYFSKRLQQEATARGWAEHVVFRGRVSDDELAAIYDGAAFYVFPSLCEGFGLPPLEAMCRGIAVTSSNASCLPEILGDAALYFDPEHPETIAEAMMKMATDTALRVSLAARGHEWSKRYDWRRCAELTLATYRDAAPHRT